MDVTLEGVTKVFGSDEAAIAALRGVELVVTSGSHVAVVGSSGSGKSTLLHLVGGLDSPSSGSIHADGVDVASLRGRRLVAHRRRLGFVFQAFNLIPSLSALENVTVPVLPYASRAGARKRATELLAEVGLLDRLDALPSQLSGGQQQRVAIARALIGDPPLLLADEPTGNLDSENADAVMGMMQQVARRRGATVLLATHDPDVAQRCDRVVTMRDGMIVADELTVGLVR